MRQQIQLLARSCHHVNVSKICICIGILNERHYIFIFQNFKLNMHIEFTQDYHLLYTIYQALEKIVFHSQSCFLTAHLIVLTGADYFSDKVAFHLRGLNDHWTVLTEECVFIKASFGVWYVFMAICSRFQPSVNKLGDEMFVFFISSIRWDHKILNLLHVDVRNTGNSARRCCLPCFGSRRDYIWLNLHFFRGKTEYWCSLEHVHSFKIVSNVVVEMSDNPMRARFCLRI